MKKLRVSSRTNLHAEPGADVVEFFKNELDFLKNVGFDAADFDTKVLTLGGDIWHSEAETAVCHSEKVGIKIETCHLPYVFGTKHSEEFYKDLI